MSGLIGSAMILASFIVSAGIFFQVKQEGFQPVTVTLFQFIHAGNLSIPFSFLVDPLSTLFLLIITGVGFLIHVYSSAYMQEENGADYAKYFSYLNLFVFSCCSWYWVRTMLSSLSDGKALDFAPIC